MTGEERVFSVVIPAYGNGELWKTAVDSVLMQEYPAIELIFADDGTQGFDTEAVRQYIKGGKRDNLVRFCVVHQEQNIGTVRNLREAHKQCTGTYLTHIAMDDAYCDASILSRYAKALDEKPKDVLGIYAKSLVCDEELNPLGKVSFNVENAVAMNTMMAIQQFGELAHYCCIHMGATAFVRTEFMQWDDFDTDFCLIEDWPFFLKVTRQGQRFQFCSFDAIFYRNGGVTDASFESPVKKICCRDHIRLYEKLILPYLSLLPWRERLRIYGKYAEDRMDMERIFGTLSEWSFVQRLQVGIKHFPAHLGVLIKRRKKLWVLWLAGTIVLLGNRSILGVLIYSAVLLIAQWLRERLGARKRN